MFRLLRTVVENELLTTGLKNQVLAAGQTGYSLPGSCMRFECRNSLVSRYDVCKIQSSPHRMRLQRPPKNQENLKVFGLDLGITILKVFI